MICAMFTKVLVTLLCFIGALASINLAAPGQQTSANEKPGAAIGVGAVAPDFTLTDQDGRKLRLAAERSQRPVVLVFYRGYW